MPEQNTLPEAFLKRLLEIIPPEKYEGVLTSFSQPKPPTFRANTLKITPEKLAEELTKRQIPFEKIAWYENAFILKSIPQKELTATDLYTQGFIYMQNLSSMIPALILGPAPGELICDLTAAPGSKTTQMAAQMQNQGTIVANDRSMVRRFKLEANLKMQGVTNTQVLGIEGQKLWQKYPEYFDKTLLDAPCSLEGTFYTGYPKSYRDWSPNKVKMLSQLQKFLLRSAVSTTKVGGIIVYSTCTLETEENEAVIDWILKKVPGALEVLDIQLPIKEMINGFTEFAAKQFNAEISKTKRILPSRLMEGFYVAKLKKVKSTIYRR